MKILSLILRIVAIIAAVVAAGAYFMTQGKLSEQESRIATIQSEAQARISDIETANQQIVKLENEAKQANNKGAESKRMLESVRSEMYTAKQELTRTQQQIKEEKNKNNELAAATDRLKADLLKTEEGLATASREGEIALLNERVRELESVNVSLKQEITTAESKMKSLSTIHSSSGSADNINSANRNSSGQTSSVTTQTTNSGYSQLGKNINPAAQPASIGAETTIASINSSAGIIVLNAPDSLGINAGSSLTLIRDLRSLGKVQITEVSNNLAIGNILSGANTRELRSGSSVKILQ